MTTALWVLQGLCAFAFLGAGTMKLATPRAKLAEKMKWANDYSDSQVKLIGLAELLGAIGLVVPVATRILPILTPIAAICLAIIMAGAVAAHRRHQEPIIPPVILGLLVTLIAVGRLA